MQQLFFGGSFNPIHHGHLICARAAAEHAGFTHITVVPSANPPHKNISATLAAADDRLSMVRLAVQDDSFFDVDTLELSRNGPSYTIDTVQELQERGPVPIHWLIGADMLMYLPKWHQAERLIDKVTFLIMARPGWVLDWELLPPVFRRLQSQVVPTPLVTLTATEIRERVAAGKSIRYLTPDRVCDYIADHHLYR